MKDFLTIGKLAKKASVSIDSIRFYERCGLIADPMRTASNYRLYPPEAGDRLRFIKRAQNLGFTLAEISELLALSHEPSTSSAEVKKITAEKIKDIKIKLRDLNRMLKALQKLDEHCDGHGSILECPILEALTKDDSELRKH